MSLHRIGEHGRGIVLVFIATLLFVALDATAKYLTRTYPVAQVVWARFFFHLLWVLVLIGPRLGRELRTRRPGLQLLRSVVMLATNGVFFLALSRMPMADANAIMFVNPLIVTALAVPLLGERVGFRSWVAVLIGFAGVLIIIRPGPDVLQSAAVLPLIASTLFAFYQIATRVLSSIDAPMTTLFYTALVGAIVTTAGLPWYWHTPDFSGIAFMAAAGLFGALGQFAFIKAVEVAPVSVIAPFNYTTLLWSALFGFVLFGDLPDRYTWLGAAIIVASGLYILHRSGVRARAGE
ncbi:MAG: DMT family transporter [Gammaproteobacteria bacterium]